jgi:hypothetical protein
MDKTGIKYKTNFSSKEKTIVFTVDALCQYCDNDLLTQIDKEEIIDIRYGISWIRGIDFVIGRIYCIDISNRNNKIIKIRLRSLYGINKMNLHKKYNEIINKLYEFYFNAKILNYVSSINNGINVEIADIIFKKEGVCLDPKKSDGFVEWEDINSRAYSYYYTLSSKRRPDFYKAFTYLTDWNAVIVYSISREIIKSKNL